MRQVFKKYQASKAIIKQIKRHDFTKELKDFEYETKFDIYNSKLDGFKVLKKIQSCFKNNQRFILCKIAGGDKLITSVSFFTKGKIEYSLFKYRGARMLKIKKHKILKGPKFSVFKSSEQLVIDKSDFSRKLKNIHYRFKRHSYSLVDLKRFLKKLTPSLIYIGGMEKNRFKDFVLDINDGKIYAVAVTFCKSKNKVQKQLEIEYAGYIQNLQKLSRKNTEKQVVLGVRKLSQYIYRYFPKMLRPSLERKFEFVKKASPEV